MDSGDELVRKSPRGQEGGRRDDATEISLSVGAAA